ncbi:UNVERIFIED_CONTAM: hypothetical protein GTU68_029326 [Idotea baltica]|nr:hypothetical protein [Idotea baltica]
MKAVVCTQYGSPDVLQLQEVATPIPKDNEVLIKVHAISITAADTMIRKGEPVFGRLFLGLTKPKNPIQGTGFAGVIVDRGNSVLDFQIGDKVFGETGVNFSAHAEYICMDEAGVIAKKPINISFEEAAPICDGALTSLNFLKEMAQIQPGQKVLINGASGSLGTAAIQLAKHFGAEVTGVCSTANLEMVFGLGADKVIDYTKENFPQGKEVYDVIYDAVGKSSFSKCKSALKKGGQYLSPVLDLTLLAQMMWTSIFGNKKAKFSATGLKPIPELRILLNELATYIEEGTVTSIIDRCYDLDEVVDAHRYVDTGHKRGNVVIAF